MANYRAFRSSARLVWATKPTAAEEHGFVPASKTEELVFPVPGQNPATTERPTGLMGINRLIHGDNLPVMQALLAQGYEGKINLIYIDPPFFSQANYTCRVTPGGADASGELPVIERPAYQDTWSEGMDAYLDMLYPRLQLMKKLLAPDGSIYIHLDASISHYIKVIMDEIFGPDSFQREIIWRIGWISGYKSAVRNWVRNHDTLLFYVKNPGRFTFNKEYIPYPPGYRRRGHQETTGKGYPLEDVWNASPAEFALKGEDSLDSIQIKSFSREKTGFATQKNSSLLRRIIRASSNPGELVADFFSGSGTTLVVAEKLDRRWLGCEIGRTGIQVTRKRLVAAGATPFSIERVETATNLPAGNNLASGTGQPALFLLGPEVIRVGDTREQITVGLKAYVPPEAGYNSGNHRARAGREDIISRARQDFSILVDYWAVDWDYDGRCFRSRWQAWKDYNKRETVPLQATAVLPSLEARTIAVQVVDIFGNEIITTANVP